jgi:predicted nucleic acid-binding protein
LSSDVQSILTRHDPARWPRTLAHRRKADLPYNLTEIPTGASLLFDTTVYIDHLKGQLPSPIVNLMASRTILHGASALAELAVTIGILDPADKRTRETLIPIIEMLARIHPSRVIVPNYEIWLEAAVVAGILARTQAIPKQDRRKFLNDVLLFLQAGDTGAVLVSRNARDLDLLLQLKPRVHVFLYDNSD